ncbi:MAG: ATP-binding protein [Gammaproteobacteria bacterium]|nr:ATP-binding protein [Gammaproteobacteria bacterium]
MFNSLSLRGRFLITPIIGIILTLILYFASNAVIRSHADLFQKLHDNNLPQISAISRSITLLANNHNALTDTLVAAISNPDEEKIYIQGRAVLNQLHQIEVELLENIHLAHRGIVQYDTILEKIRLAFIYYQESSIRAIELSSVNSQRAIKELIYVSKASQQLNESFLTLSDYHTEHITDTSKLLGSTLYDQNIVTALAVILILVMIVSALYFSDRMSSEIQQAEQMIIEAREEAERSNQDKSDFLSRMSHELRTPLNVVTGYIELLNTTPLSKEQQDYIKSVQAGSSSLLSIINDVLDFAKIDSGKLTIDFSTLSINDMLDELNNMFSLTAAEKNIQFNITTSANVPDSINSDFNRLKQILVNLLSNAIKFTEHGSVNLLIDATPAEIASRIKLVFKVEDSGIGIHEEYLDKIFNHFEQQSGQDSRKYGGSGLGLAISQKLALLLNGELTVTSYLNQGSTFTLTLNDVEVTQNHNPSADELPEIVLRPATILIADDMEANRKLLINYLRNHSITFLEACNGTEAVQFAQEQNPDLILMDIKMPEMDGIEATTILRANDATKDIPIIAISASSIHEDNSDLKEKLFNDYLTKPLKLNTLIQKLSLYLNR